MKKWGRFTIGGLQHKIFNLCIILVVTAITAFAIVAVLQLRAQSELSEKTEIETNNTIKKISGESLMDLTEISMSNIAGDSADMIDYEFWTCWHDLTLLSDMAADIIANPQVYGEIEVYEPDKANQGEYVLQLLKADWADESDEKAMSQVRKLANLEPMMVDIVGQNSDFLLDSWFDPDVSCYSEKDGEINGLFLFHKLPSGMFMIQLMITMSQDAQAVLLGMMRQFIISLEEVYGPDAKVILDRHNQSSLQLTEKLLPRGFGIPVYIGSKEL